MVYGHPLRSLVPTYYRAFAKELAKDADQAEGRSFTQRVDHYNLSTKKLPPLEIGQQVRIQNTISKRWDRTGVIVEV
jgi:hypothetical protein